MMYKAIKRFALVTILGCYGSVAVAGIPVSQSGLPDLVEKLIPAVVNIATSQKLPERRQALTPHELYQDFFQQFGLPPGLMMPFGMEEEDAPSRAKRRQVTSLGSGFIIDPNGFIVTNQHVIEGADEITVTLSNETQLKAKVIGGDRKTDLALLKVESKTKLPFVEFGDSDKVRVGETIVAIGNPFGLGGTVTSGIISALDRNLNSGPFDNFMQTDAAINKGNSGGPMFNMSGEVIGINTAIVSPSGGSVGIGFATPSSLAKSVIEQLKTKGKVRRGMLGVSIQDVTEEMSESLGLSKESGAAVSEVAPGSPAERAGIKVGDIIVSFDGKPVTKTKRLTTLVAETSIGKKVNVEVFRNGKNMTVAAVIGEMPEEEKNGDKSKPSDSSGKEEGVTETVTLNGMKMAPINPIIRDRFSLDSQLKGMIVLSLSRDSALAMVGLRRGDIVIAINQQPVETAAMAKTVISNAEKEKRQNILLTVKRQNQTILVTVPLK